MNDKPNNDPRLYAIPDIHGHAKGEHKAFTDERPIPLSARMLFLWFYHACRRGWPRFLMVSDHMNYLTFEDPAAINLVRRALKLAQAGDLYGAAETASVEVGHAAVVSEGLRRGMRYSIGAEVDNDPRSRPDAQNIVDAMKPDGMIRSVHFLTIDHPTHGPNWNWPFDNPEFADVYDVVGTAKTWELYMTTLLDAVERLPGNILGHFYVPAVFGHWPDDATLEGYEDRIVEACEARGMAIELNTRFLYRAHSDEEKAKYLAVHRRLLVKCKEKNVGIAIGSDAHSPKDQGAGFAAVLALLDECEINELVFPIAGRLARVALRVDRKTEPAGEPVRIDDRKPARKAARPSAETPADDISPEPPEELSAAAKPKPRPKRSRSKPPEVSESVGILETVITITPQPASEPADPDPSGELAAAGDRALETPALKPPRSRQSGAKSAREKPPATSPAAAAEPTSAPIVVETPEETVADPISEIVREAEFEPIVAEVPVPVEATPQLPSDEGDVPVEPPLVVSETNAVSATAPPIKARPRKSRPIAGPVKSKAAAQNGKVPASAANAAAKKVAKPATKTAAAKTPVKKAPAKKAPLKKSAPAKKAVAAKKVVEKKVSPKKGAVRATMTKKSTTKKSSAKKTASKKPAQRRR